MSFVPCSKGQGWELILQVHPRGSRQRWKAWISSQGFLQENSIVLVRLWWRQTIYSRGLLDESMIESIPFLWLFENLESIFWSTYMYDLSWTSWVSKKKQEWNNFFPFCREGVDSIKRDPFYFHTYGPFLVHIVNFHTQKNEPSISIHFACLFPYKRPFFFSTQNYNTFRFPYRGEKVPFDFHTGEKRYLSISIQGREDTCRFPYRGGNKPNVLKGKSFEFRISATLQQGETPTRKHKEMVEPPKQNTIARVLLSSFNPESGISSFSDGN